MFSVAIVLKLAILICLIRYLLNTGNIRKTSLYFAGTYLLLGIAIGFSAWSAPFFLGLLVFFIIDLVTGYCYFWLIDRYESNYLMFYLVIIFGVVLSVGLRIFLNVNAI